MIFTAFSLVLMTFFGVLFDDLSRTMISLIFGVVFLFVFEHYIYSGLNKFVVLSIGSMMPYGVWLALDHSFELGERYGFVTLMKVVPLFALVIAALEIGFHYMTNSTFRLWPPSAGRPRRGDDPGDARYGSKPARRTR